MLHLLSLLRAASHPTFPELSSSLPRRRLLATSTRFSVKDYLVGACGLTAAQALKASKKLPHLTSASNPDAVLALLSGVGLSRPDIAAVVAADPLLLGVGAGDVARRLASLRDRVGLSDPQIARLLAGGGAKCVRAYDAAAPRLQFWIPFLGGSFDLLLKFVKNNNALLHTDLDKVVKPNVALLREECGMSDRDIASISRFSRILVFNPERVKEFVRRADDLGVPRASAKFKTMVGIVSCFTEEKVTAKMEFLRSTLGCSMEKLCLGLRKTPNILGYSEDVLRRKIEFMVNEVGLEPDYILEMSVLLTYSLEKRILPRHCVLKILRTRGLVKKGTSFRNMIGYGEGYFVAKYIDRYQDAVPGLADSYATACSGKMPAGV